MALGIALGIPWGTKGKKVADVKTGNYPPSGGPGTLYLATDSPNLEWANVAGVWRPIVDGVYLGTAPGDVTQWPYIIPGWDGHGMAADPRPGVPRWKISTGQSLAVHAAARAFGNGIGAHADAVMLHEHDTVSGTNTGQDYGAGLFVGESATRKCAAISLAYTAGSPNRVAAWTCADWAANNWGTVSAPYTEIDEGVRRPGTTVLRAIRTAAATITFATSRNGVIWEPVATWAESSAGAADRIGVTLLSSYNGTNPVAVSVLSWAQS